MLPGAAQQMVNGCGVYLGTSVASNQLDYVDMQNALSPDGALVVWSDQGCGNHLYLRNVTERQTVQLDAVQGGSGAGEVHRVLSGRERR